MEKIRYLRNPDDHDDLMGLRKFKFTEFDLADFVARVISSWEDIEHQPCLKGIVDF